MCTLLKWWPPQPSLSMMEEFKYILGLLNINCSCTAIIYLFMLQNKSIFSDRPVIKPRQSIMFTLKQSKMFVRWHHMGFFLFILQWLQNQIWFSIFSHGLNSNGTEDIFVWHILKTSWPINELSKKWNFELWWEFLHILLFSIFT